LLRKNSGVQLQTSAELEIVKDIKEKVCYVAYNIDNYEKEYALTQGGGSGGSAATGGSGGGADGKGVDGVVGAGGGGSSSGASVSAASLLGADESEPEIPYKLPDGSVIHVGSEKFRACEALFNPALLGKECLGVPALLVQCISRCDMDLRRTLFSHITLAGGSTLFDGFGDRLLSEVRRLAPRDTRIKIWAPPDRILSTWIGGSILASLATFKNMWVTKKEYDEGGRNAIYRKMF
jgi:centractin